MQQRRRNTQSTLNVQFPAAGLSEERAIRETPPFATADCMNVRPENVFNRRRMGGSRPGVAKFFDQDLGAEIRCLKPLTYIKEDDVRTFYNDPFDTDIYPSGDWETDAWFANGTLITEGGFVEGGSAGGQTKGCVLRDVLSSATSLAEYTVEALIAPFRDASTPVLKSCAYTIWLRMDNTTPVGTTDGIRIDLEVNGTAYAPNYDFVVYKYVGGVRSTIALMSGTLGSSISGNTWTWLRCKVTSTNTLNIFYGSETALTFTIPAGPDSQNIALPAAAGRRVGLSMVRTATSNYTDPGRVDTFRIRYAGTPDRERTVAFAIASGNVWRETEIGVMEQSASTVTLDSGRIQATEYLQKMYLADCKLLAGKVSVAAASFSATIQDLSGFGLITSYTIASKVATLTCTTTAGMVVGQYVTNINITDGTSQQTNINGTFKITAKTATTYSFACNAPDIGATAVNGAAVVYGVVIDNNVFAAACTVGEDVIEYEFINSEGVQLGGGVTPVDLVVGNQCIIRNPILGIPDGATTFNMWLWRGAKVYDPVADTLTLWQTDSLVAESFNIVGVKSESGTITYTTQPAHKFSIGQRILISVLPIARTGGALPVPVSTTPGNINNSEISGVFTVTQTDPVSAAPTTFQVEKSIGSDNLATAMDDIGTRKEVIGFKKRVTTLGVAGVSNAVARIKTTRKHAFTAGDFVTLAGQTSSNLDGTWEITAIVDAFTIEVQANGATFGAVDTGLKIWPGSVYTAKGTAQLADYQGKGYVPAGCSLINNWRGRMILCRGNTAFYSRIDDPNDFDYGEVDEASAVASTLTDGGVIGQPITAVCPVDEDTVIFGCKNEVWRQTGDPAAGGKLYNVSRKVGVVDASAWTITPDGLFVFLSEDGIYSYSVKSPATVPVPVTAKPLPKKLRNLSTATINVSMAFDTLAKGVHLFVSFDSGFTTHWFLDWQDKGMWPVRFGDTSCDPMCCTAFNGRDPSEGGVLLGCRDGYVRMHRDGQGTDDGVPFDSYLCFGPIRPAGNQTDAGTIMEMTVHPVRDYALANTVKVELFPGYNHQEALEREKTGTAIYTDTFDAVQPLTDMGNPQVSAGSFAIKVSSNNTVFPWGLEAVSLAVQNDGPNYRRG